MNNEEQGFSLAEGAMWLLGAVLTIQIGWLAYNAGHSIAQQPFPEGQGGGAAMTAATPSAPKPADGRALFAGNCAGCHGAQAEGAVGPNLHHAGAWTLAEFTEATLHGVTPDGRTLSPVMPHFADAGFDGAPATDEQLEAIHNYLASLK